MGMIQKLFIFFIILNSLVAFAGSSGMLGADANVNRASDYIDSLRGNALDANTDETSSSGIQILEYFNPLNYSIVVNGLALVTGFFVDPIFMFALLPAPLGVMFGTLFAVLEITAIIGFIRGFAP